MVRVGDAAVLSGILALPRTGVWHADLHIDTERVPSGPVEISIDGQLVLKGTVTGGGAYRGGASVRIGAGADGLRKMATPKHYVRPVIRTVLADLMRASGEVASPAIAPALLGRSIPSWAVLGLPVGVMLAALVKDACPEGTGWRALPDGTIWLGPEAWPASTVKEYTELDRSVRDDYVELGLVAPLLLPGTVLGEDRLDYIEHHIEQDRVWARAWLQ